MPSRPPERFSMVDRLTEFGREADEIQARLYAAAEEGDRLDSTLKGDARHRIADAVRRLHAIADELAAHASRSRIHLQLG